MYKLTKPKVWNNIQRKTLAQLLRDRGGSSWWQERRVGSGGKGFCILLFEPVHTVHLRVACKGQKRK